MPLSGKELVKLYKKNGWILDRVKGSHHIMRNKKTGETMPIPVHGNKSLGKGLERSLLKKLGVK
jgi:predicted RNA binding protein YcfA (HicA-like mRNA interferase family)